VTDRQRRVVRRNQVVFLESEGETNRTVSRAQAHITRAAPGDYRLHDDRSSYGTRIVRDGKMIELPSGSPRGVKLQAGDEGTAHLTERIVELEAERGEIRARLEKLLKNVAALEL
jgi:hypothetical protein